MSSKIIGVTAGTPTSISKVEKEMRPVKTVNGVEPDENGNVQVAVNPENGQENLNSHVLEKNNPHGVTAEQAGARPDTWLPTIAEIGAAPAGYGLANDFATVTTVAELNKQTKNGWVRYSNASASLVSGFKAFYALIRTDSYTNNVGYEYCTQTAYITNESTLNGAILQRHCLYGAWSPWEWVNPPMASGVEYRTTERWEGKPVYTKAVNFGNLPNSTLKSLGHEASATRIIRYAGSISSGDAIPLWYQNSSITLDVSTTQVTITSSYDATARTAVVEMWYTKD